MVNIPKSRSEYRGGTAKLSPLCILICLLKTKISRMKKKKRSRQLPSLYMIAFCKAADSTIWRSQDEYEISVP